MRPHATDEAVTPHPDHVHGNTLWLTLLVLLLSVGWCLMAVWIGQVKALLPVPAITQHYTTQQTYLTPNRVDVYGERHRP